MSYVSDATEERRIRPCAVTGAAVSLAACAALHVGLFIVLASDGDSFITNVWLTVTLMGLAGFVVATLLVWRGRPGGRAVTWLVAIASGPWCGMLGTGVISAIAPPPGASKDASFGPTATNIVTAGILGLLVVALVVALVLLALPASGIYFRQRSGTTGLASDGS